MTTASSASAPAAVVPLDELLASGALSGSVLRLDPACRDGGDMGGGEDDGSGRRCRRHLNAARTSLLLVEAVAGVIDAGGGGGAIDDGLRTSDFRVRLATTPSGAGPRSGFPEKKAAGSCEPAGGCRFLMGVELVPREGEEASGVESKIDNDGAPPRRLSSLSFSPPSPIQIAGRILHAIFTCGSAADPLPSISSMQPMRVSELSNNSNSSLEVDDGQEDFHDSTPRSRRRRRRGDPGSLFSTLLERGDLPVSVCRLLSDMMDSEGGMAEGGTTAGSGANSFRRSSTGASDDVSFLSLDSSCKDGHRGGNSTAFSSFGEVIQDLKQMSDDPQTFLYDQGSDFYSSTLQLGQGHYGRSRELTALLELSVQAGTTASVKGANGGEGPATGDAVGVALVSGPAGGGKSHLVQHAGDVLRAQGTWMVLRAKFHRSPGRGSREVVSSLFDRLVADVASDVDRRRRAAAAVSAALDPGSLSSLARFVPSLRKLVPGVNRSASRPAEEEDHWRLVFLLSKLMGAILSLDRHVFMFLDDLQWCDSTMIGLVVETLIAMSQSDGPSDSPNRAGGGSCLVVVGAYRDDEVTESHPLVHQRTVLRKSGTIDVAEIKLPCLSRDDVVDMLTAGARLPRRLVHDLAGAVHKKTSGHAMYVVQLLNTLVRDSVIAYSPMQRRFDWDERRLAALRTDDSVASLIVSNLSRLRPEELRSLRVLSCLGMQSDLSLIKLLDASPVVAPKQGRGIESFLPGLVEGGILEMSGSSIVFSHDLIQQHVYESVPADDRRQLHLDIGVLLGSTTALDAHFEKSSIEGGVDKLYLSDGSSSSDSVAKPPTLTSIITDQINAAGPGFVTDGSQRVRFAYWNLRAGREAAERSDFRAARSNHEGGIAFLTPDGLWGGGDATRRLCRELHEGAAFTSFALGDAADVERRARAVIENVPFEDSLAAQDLHVRSLKGAGEYARAIATGLAVLRLLKIDVATAPTPLLVFQAMSETGKVTSKYTSDQITNLKQTSINARKRTVLKIVDAVIVACYREASPYLPLVTCAMVNYSLQNGVCEESATAFVVYGYFKIFVENNFEEGRRWGDIALKILDPNSAFTPMTLYGFLFFWFQSHQKVASTLLNVYETGMRVGDVDTAMYAFCLSLRFSFFGGINLSILSQSYTKAFTQMAKYSKECLKFAVVDALVIQGLTGFDLDPFSGFDGMIQNENVLLANAKYKKHHQGLESIYTGRLFSAFWAGNYTDANRLLELSLTIPSSKMPKIQLIYHTFYRGLIAYQMHRNGDGEEHMDQGKKVLDKMELWNQRASKAVFENKLYLLEAEHYASNCNIQAAKESYELSAKTARDHGLVHEQGLAYELYGKFLTSIGEPDASHWFQQAYSCYVQWGAVAKAEQLRKDGKLGSPEEVTSTFNPSLVSIKHGRDEDEAEELI